MFYKVVRLGCEPYHEPAVLALTDCFQDVLRVLELEEHRVFIFFVIDGSQVKVCFQHPEGGLYLADDVVKFLSWTLPGVIALISWGIQIALTLKKLRNMLLDDVMRRVKGELDKIEDRIASKSVEQLWVRIPTLLKIRDYEPKDANTSEVTPK